MLAGNEDGGDALGACLSVAVSGYTHLTQTHRPTHAYRERDTQRERKSQIQPVLTTLALPRPRTILHL